MDESGDRVEPGGKWLLLEFPKNGGPSLRLEGIFNTEAAATEAAVQCAEAQGNPALMNERTSIQQALDSGRCRFIIARAVSKLRFETEIVVRLVDEDELESGLISLSLNVGGRDGRVRGT